MGVNQFAEGVGVAVIGETHLPDGAACLFCRQPLQNAHVYQTLPGVCIGQHVHQIIVDIVSLQPLQLGLKQLFQTIDAVNQVMGQFCCDIDLVADPVLCQHLAQRRFVAGINVGRIKIVDAAADGGHNLRLGLFHIGHTHGSRKTHAPEPEDGNVISVFIFAIVHRKPPKFIV